jgi:hypothetical protein
MQQQLLLIKGLLGNGLVRVGAGSDAVDEAQERGPEVTPYVIFLFLVARAFFDVLCHFWSFATTH